MRPYGSAWVYPLGSYREQVRCSARLLGLTWEGPSVSRTYNVNIPEWQRRFLESSFGCAVLDFYRATPTLSIIGGRGRDLLVTKTGYCVIQAGLATRFVPSLLVEKLQFYQEKKGEALIRIVRRSGYTPEHTRMLLDELTKEVGDSMAFSWEYVDDIPRGPSGKYQFVVSHVQLEL